MKAPELRFVPLEAVDANQYQLSLRSHLPYSSFNFVSLHCYWPNARVALMPDGVALVLDDLQSGHLYLTALTSDGHSIAMLGSIARDMELDTSLRLVPECSLKNLPTGFHLSERRDGFDYIIDIRAMLDERSELFRAKHEAASAFAKTHAGLCVREVSLAEPDICAALIHIDVAWRSRRNGSNTGTLERRAFLRCIERHEHIDLIVLLAETADGTPVGFTINENLRDGYYMAHYGKTLPGHEGLSEFLELHTAHVMQKRGFQWMNFQEDLGNPGLRKMKLSWNPCRLFRVFDVRAD